MRFNESVILLHIRNFLPSRCSFTNIEDSQDSRRKEGVIFIPLCHFQLRTSRYWLFHYEGRCHIETSDIYFRGELKFDWLMMTYSFLFTWWFNSRFHYSNLTQASAEFEFAWTVTLIIQANQPTKWACHIRSYSFIICSET